MAKQTSKKLTAAQVETLLYDEDGLTIMDAVADIIAERFEVDLEKVKRDIQALTHNGTQDAYEGYIAKAIDQLADSLGYQ